MKNQPGFTIIELVIVILLLGILTATALPRFIDVSDKAHTAVVKAVYGGLGTSTGVFHAQYISNGKPVAGSEIAGFGDGTQRTNSNGYPSGTADDGIVSDSIDCVAVFNGILQGGRPGLKRGSDSPLPPNTKELDFTGSSDFETARSGTTCYFIYTAQSKSVSAPYIEYNSITGQVTQPGSIFPES